jgi:hypothetical protein
MAANWQDLSGQCLRNTKQGKMVRRRPDVIFSSTLHQSCSLILENMFEATQTGAGTIATVSAPAGLLESIKPSGMNPSKR